MHIAVEGCGHGDLDAIYAEIQRREVTIGCRVDLLIICGDFQAVRNFGDLATMACPVRYRKLGDFHRYYSGEKKAPVLTLFIGGNHEASNHLQELYYGGWVCPNIYYLGAAGVVRYGGLRISGISGIYNQRDYKKGRFEQPPYNRDDERSIYHVRGYDVERLALIREGVHVMASHDWPCNIEKYGNVERLISQKRHFAKDIYNGCLGSPPNMFLLQRLQPLYWFSAHMHAYFTATYVHPVVNAGTIDGTDAIAISNPDAIPLGDLDDDSESNDDDVIQFQTSIQAIEPIVTESNPEAISLAMSDDDDEEAEETSSSSTNINETTTITAPVVAVVEKFPTTTFLALSKRESRYEFLDIIEIDDNTTESTPILSYDPEWLAILRATRSYLSLDYHQPNIPSNDAIYRKIDQERAWIDANIANLQVPHNFTITAPPPTPDEANGPVQTQAVTPRFTRNPQTTQFCQMLGIVEPIW
ncbi:DBR1-domain-containing protein [Syncephalis plumigaleata]|nr:DBR1-domain-containing protein [Syncephalis plumigaleata]